jgi:uncharacterized damage-inducible protein DinB
MGPPRGGIGPALDPVPRTLHDSGMTTPSQQGSAPASHATLLFPDFKHELATTRRVLERYPDGRGDWKPDPKSRSISELASHIVDMIGLGADLLETDSVEYTTRTGTPNLDTAQALTEAFDRNAARLTSALQGASDDALAQRWTLLFHGHPGVTGVRRELLRSFLMSHLIHHRAQLAGYYRALGIPVPPIYGPTADER